MSTTNNSDQSDKAWTLSHISAIKINYSQHWVSNHQNPVTRHTLQKRAWIISNFLSYLCKTLRFLRSCSSTSISFNFFVIRLTLDWSENFSLSFFPNSSFPISLTKWTFHVIIMFSWLSQKCKNKWTAHKKKRKKCYVRQKSLFTLVWVVFSFLLVGKKNSVIFMDDQKRLAGVLNERKNKE